MWRLKYFIVKIEILIINFLKFFFNYKQDINKIPDGLYCYVWDDKKNILHTDFFIKKCKYFRYINNDKCISGCTYVGFIGFDMIHWDSCKICGKKENLEKWKNY